MAKLIGGANDGLDVSGVSGEEEHFFVFAKKEGTLRISYYSRSREQAIAGSNFLFQISVPSGAIGKCVVIGDGPAVSQSRGDSSGSLLPVSREWLHELGFFNDSHSMGLLRFEIAPGIRVVAEACVGGWAPFQIWTGSGKCHEKNNATRGDVLAILKALDLK